MPARLRSLRSAGVRKLRRDALEIQLLLLRSGFWFREARSLKTKSKLSLEKTAVRLFGPGGRLPGSSTT